MRYVFITPTMLRTVPSPLRRVSGDYEDFAGFPEPPVDFLLPPPAVPDDVCGVSGGVGIVGPSVLLVDCVDAFVDSEAEGPAAVPLDVAVGAGVGAAWVPPQAGVAYWQGWMQGGTQMGISRCCDTP